MNDDDYEYDPAYQEAYKQTLEYRTRQLSYAIDDVGTAIGRAALEGLLPVKAALSELHASEVAAMGWLRREWHFLTGHRRK